MFGVTQKRLFTSTAVTQVPRKYRLPTKYNSVTFPDGWSKTPVFKRIVSPQVPSQQQLAAPSMTMQQYLASLPKKEHLVAPAEPRKAPGPLPTEQRGKVQRSMQPLRFSPRYPLPMTYAPGQDFKTWLADMKKQPEPLTDDPKYFPYTYYEVTMIRGLIGLPEKTKAVARSLGLRVVNQVVYHRVSSATAGKLLKLKELVRLRLVNEIPKEVKCVAGFRKVGNVIGQSVHSLTSTSASS